jgi:hypothetical protein
MNRAAGMLGNSPVYNQFNFDLTNYKIKTVVDTKMPVPVALFRIGGFTFTVFIIFYLFVYLWNYFYS